MASVAKAAIKPIRERRMSDQVRIKAGHMLTYDDLSHRPDIAERHIMHRVLHKKIVNNTGFMALPLTLAYFTFYCGAVMMHEDITNVWFLESTMRMHLDGMFSEVETTNELWDAFLGGFVDVYFNQKDSYGNTLPKSFGDGDKWGLWGRVDSYNQIQAAVRVTSTRTSLDDFGSAYSCASNVTCNLCRSNYGFQVSSKPVLPTWDCGSWSGRRLEDELEGNSTASLKGASLVHDLETTPADDAASERRLSIGRPELASSLPQGAKDQEDKFTFFIYPSRSQAEIREQLQYFRDREWIDGKTTNMEVRMYLLNNELGRQRIEQLNFNFAFSEGGGIYYTREVQCVFLVLFSGMLNVLADLMWFVVLAATTLFRIRILWKAFLVGKMFETATSAYNLWEWIILMAGWFNVYGFYRMYAILNLITDQLKTIRAFGWNLGEGQVDAIVEMFEVSSQSVYDLANLRGGMNYYIILLMFRFFVSFGAQPRLAVVTKTMSAVMTDMIHFLIVFLPTFIAYVISGNLLFGRKFEGFATLQGSFGTCFRFAMESEYDWYMMSEEYYWYVAAWTWSFVLMIILLMLNMVLAIILDIYNEVREASHSKIAEPIWDTIYNFAVRFINIRNWVTERRLEKSLMHGDLHKHTLIRLQDLHETFPHIPEPETENLYFECRKDMHIAAERDLDKTNLLKATGSVLVSLKDVNGIIRTVNKEESQDPLHSWMAPEVQETSGAVVGHHEGTLDTFLTVPVKTKGSHFPKVTAAGVEDPDDWLEMELREGDPGFDEAMDGDVPVEEVDPSDEQPAWLQDVHSMLSDQRKWIEHAQWQIKKMQWEVQLAHMSKKPSAGARGKVI